MELYNKNKELMTSEIKSAGRRIDSEEIEFGLNEHIISAAIAWKETSVLSMQFMLYKGGR